MTRYAIYLTPSPGSALGDRSAAWLGRDPFGGREVERPGADGVALDVLTADARRYGFHGTMKAPFRLAAGQDEAALMQAFDTYCAGLAPLAMPALEIGNLGGFFALVPAGTAVALNALAEDVVRRFEPFRAPLTDIEIERRNPTALSELQRVHLRDWGYPYVMSEFRFHMTLTMRVPEEKRPDVREALDAWFGDLLPARDVGMALAIFVQNGPDMPFVVHTWRALETAREDTVTS